MERVSEPGMASHAVPRGHDFPPAKRNASSQPAVEDIVTAKRLAALRSAAAPGASRRARRGPRPQSPLHGCFGYSCRRCATGQACPCAGAGTGTMAPGLLMRGSRGMAVSDVAGGRGLRARMARERRRSFCISSRSDLDAGVKGVFVSRAFSSETLPRT